MRLIDADAIRDEWLGAIGEYTANEILNSIDDIPAVPHEMTARELLYAERRMYNEDSDAYWEYSDLIIKEEIEHAVCYIKKWAQAHPEERSEDDV